MVLRFSMLFKSEESKPDIPSLNPHELWHTCGTLLYEQIHNIRTVSHFLGHANINIASSIYVHDNVDNLRKSLGL